MTSNAYCTNQATAISEFLSIIVKPILNPSVVVSSTKDSICLGENVIFTASPFNCGNEPTYRWYINGQVKQQNSAVFNTGDLLRIKIYVEMTINESCSSLSKVVSNKVNIKVNSKILPSVEIASSANPVCEGEQVTLTASTLNGGSFPSYKWYLNDEQQTGNTEIFTSSGFSDGSVIKCLLISNADCLQQNEVFSNEIKMIVNTVISPSVSIETPSNIVNECDLVTFTAIPYSSVSSSTLKWYVNHELIAYGPIFSSDSLDDGAKVYCTLSLDEECVFPSVAYSDTLTISIKPLLKPEIIFSGDTISVSTYYSSQYSYLWYFNGEAVSTSHFLLCSQFGNGLYYLKIKNNDCIISSDSVNVSCNSLNTDWITEPEFSVYPNPASGIVYLNSTGFKNKIVNIEVHDMLGNKIIQEFISFDDHGESSLNISKLKDGAYIIIVFDNENKKYWYHKLLIN